MTSHSRIHIFVFVVFVGASASVSVTSAASAASNSFRETPSKSYYREGDTISLKVNKITSTKTLFPLDYYNLPVCQPDNGVRSKRRDGLGGMLLSDLIQSSPYELQMKKDVYCKKICVTYLGARFIAGRRPRKRIPNAMIRAIRSNYQTNWILDNDLPAASQVEDEMTITTRYWGGVPIGYIDPDDGTEVYVNNHLNIIIQYTDASTPSNAVETDDKTVEDTYYRILRLTIQPFSVRHEFEVIRNETTGDGIEYSTEIRNPIFSCDPKHKGEYHTEWKMVKPIPQPATGDVLFTYDVLWRYNRDLQWSNRWDVYLTMDNAIPHQVRWHSFINSLVVLVTLSTVGFWKLAKRLRGDIARYSALPTDEEREEELLLDRGWTSVHADVFRAPAVRPELFATCCGAGVHTLSSILLTLIFCSCGLLSEADTAKMVRSAMLIFAMFGIVNGYVTARLRKAFGGDRWQDSGWMAAVCLPGIFFGHILLMTIVSASLNSTMALPPEAFVLVLLLWWGLLSPLTFLGSYVGHGQAQIGYPTETSSAHRRIPEQPWHLNLPFVMAVSGILPFAAAFVESYFLLSSFWMEQYYNVFGFLLLDVLLVIATCADFGVIYTYQQLSRENYEWWWRSFLTSGSVALFVFVYSIEFFSECDIQGDLRTLILYFGSMAVICLALFLATGCVGVFASLWFNRMIFGYLKNE